MSYFPTSNRRPSHPVSANGRRSETAIASIGHVALAVRDLERSVTFYRDGLGFALVGSLGELAAFLAFGADHHRLTLVAAPASAPGADPAGAHRLAVRFPFPGALAAAVRRLGELGVELGSGADGAVRLGDPDGHRLELRADGARSVWPRESSGALRLVRTPPWSGSAAATA